VVEKSDVGLIFDYYPVTINIWTTKIKLAKMPLESLLTDIFIVVAVISGLKTML